MSADTDVLESRYRRLLRLYPAAYRHARGGEMLDTLMQLARPGQRRPDPREVAWLALGALRTRTGAGRDRSARQSWRGVHRLAVLFLLAAAVADPAVSTIRLVQSLVSYPGGLVFDPVDVGPTITLATGVAALLTTAAGHKWWGLALCLADTVVVEWSVHWLDVWSALLQGVRGLLPLSMAALLLVMLPRRSTHAYPRPWAWLLAVPLMTLTLPYTIGYLVDLPGPWLWYGCLVLFLLWTVVDPRVPVAVSAVTLTIPLTTGAIVLTRNFHAMGPVVPVLAYVLAPFVPLLVGGLRIARTARL